MSLYEVSQILLWDHPGAFLGTFPGHLPDAATLAQASGLTGAEKQRFQTFYEAIRTSTESAYILEPYELRSDWEEISETPILPFPDQSGFYRCNFQTMEESMFLVRLSKDLACTTAEEKDRLSDVLIAIQA